MVLETDMADIKKALVDICDVKLLLDFVAVPDEDLGTADSLRHIKDKIKVNIIHPFLLKASQSAWVMDIFSKIFSSVSFDKILYQVCMIDYAETYT